LRALVFNVELHYVRVGLYRRR